MAEMAPGSADATALSVRSPNNSMPAPTFRPSAWCALSAAVALLGFAQSLRALPVINEINFHPQQPGPVTAPTGPEDVLEEWVEICNPDGVAADLTGWKLSNAVSFSFPPGTVLPAGGCLVVAANAAAFHAAHPPVSNYVGGWLGQLSNVDDAIEMHDATGTTVDKVHYYTDGDWAKRRDGGVDPRNATINGATAPVPPLMIGWTWVTDADGAGRTLELRNPQFAKNNGQAWAVSTAAGGTPGQANSALTANIAPIIEEVQHRPEVPTHTQVVTISARVQDEADADPVFDTAAYKSVVTAKWRVSTSTTSNSTPWNSLPMHDDGLNGDEIANDGVFSGVLPSAHAAGMVVEFYVQAADASASVRTWPAPTTDTGTQGANCVWQVDEEAYTGVQPLYRLIMPVPELAAYDAIGFSTATGNDSNQQFNTTFTAWSNGGWHVRYLSSTRLRGAGSRSSHPRGVRVDTTLDNPWQGNTGMNLNSQYTYLQHVGAQLSHAAGMHVADAKPVQLRWNGVNRNALAYAGSNFSRHYGSVVHVEPINRGFVKHHFPEDNNGNLYTKRSSSGSTYWDVAPGGTTDLGAWYGATPPGWEKQNNASARDWTDLHNFVSVMTANYITPTSAYLANVSGVLDVDQWLETIALAAILTDGETNLTNGRDDDYSMYRGGDGRMRLLFHDLDTILGLGDSSAITQADLPYTILDCVEAGKTGDIFSKLTPFFSDPVVIQKYYATLSRLMKGPFSKAQFDATVTKALTGAGWAAADIDPVKTSVIAFMDARRADILAKITKPLAGTAGFTVTNGYETTPATTTASATITGTFDPATASHVFVNGVEVGIDPKTGTFGAPTSATIQLVVPGDDWKYWDAGTLPAANWATAAYTDTAWSNGPSPLGYSPSNQDGAATIISGGVYSHNADYFRKTVAIKNPSQFSSLEIRIQRDDGAIVYLNGTELSPRSNMPAGAVTAATTASGTVAVETEWVVYSLPPSGFLAAPATNLLAVEVHQAAGTSDCRFNMEVVGIKGFPAPTVTLNPGITRLTVEETDAAGLHLRYSFLDILRDVTPVAKSGTLAASTTWTAAGGPYQLTGDMPIGAGVALTIQPGATVYMGAASSFTVSGTGRLLAEGTPSSHIRFTRKPGTTDAYGAVDFIGATNESRLVWCDIERGAGKNVGSHTATIHDNGGSKVFIDHCQFFNSDAQYFSSDASSFIISNCWFQTYSVASSRPEMLHGVGGIPAGGYGIIQSNIFGHTFGFNDIFDLTDGNRTANPSATHTAFQSIDNIFTAATDDCLDLDSTDCWVEGNVFMHVHEDANRPTLADTGSGVSGGLDYSPQPSQWTIHNNIFYDVDHATLGKGGVRYSFTHNTVVHCNGNGGVAEPQNVGVLNVTDDGVALPSADQHADVYVENNVIHDAPRLVPNYGAVNQVITFNNNILDQAWAGPGAGNQIVVDPGLHLELIDQSDPLWTYGMSNSQAFQDYEVVWRKIHAAFAPCPGSPAYGTGPGGTNKGGGNPRGVLLSGVPAATTSASSATITVGPTGTMAAGTGTFAGKIPLWTWGFVSYKYKIDSGAYSAEIPITTPISLTGLSAGTHTLQVLGKNASGSGTSPAGVEMSWESAPTVRVWTVDPAFVPQIVLNEILASNVAAYTNGTAHPDYIELRNPGTAAVDISGWAVSDDPLLSGRYVIPAGTTLAGGATYLLKADADTVNPGPHTGFGLDSGGEAVTLSKPNGVAWTVVDTVTFGLQIADLSVGRVGADSHWDLNVPTPGAVNILKPNTCAGRVVFNEWLANAEISFADDQVELYNGSTLPANIGGWFLTDTPDSPHLFTMPPLSFVPALGFASLVADSQGGPGVPAHHLNFSLDAFYDWIVLSMPDDSVVDQVQIVNALPDVPEGRQPDGAATVVTFALPTFGLANPQAPGTNTTTTLVKTQTICDFGSSFFFYDKDTGQGATWNQPGFDPTTAASWRSAVTPLGVETNYTGSIPGFTNTSVAVLSPVFDHTTTQTTDYFRSPVFSLQNLSSTAPGATYATQFKLTQEIDDGAVFYLDGTELPYRYGMPAGAFTATTKSNNSVTEAALVGPITLTGVPAGYTLGSGGHVFAAEVHQVSSSSDVVFNARLVAETYETVTTSTGTNDPVYNRMLDLMTWLRITEVMFDPAAFPGVPSVYGPFAKKLSNSGDLIVLDLPLPYTASIQRFSYSDLWFKSADGNGASIEIINPLAADRAGWYDKNSWQASLTVGGSPNGQTVNVNFGTWLNAFAISGANADTDSDGLDHLLEYALALDPQAGDTERGLVTPGVDATDHLLGTFVMPAHPPTDLSYRVEVAETMQSGNWITVATRQANGSWTGTAAVATGANIGGRTAIQVRDPDGLSGHQHHFIRLRVSLVP